MEETILFAGHGYVFRCPKCQRVDRIGDAPRIVECRFCETAFQLKVVTKTNATLNRIVREIEDLESGISVSPERVASLDKEVLKELQSLLVGNPSPQEMRSIPAEIVDEAKCRILMRNHRGLDKQEKLDVLKRNGYKGRVNGEGRVYVFFGSTVAPECDTYLYFED
jgi:hypothetical protein